jgi:RNA polymerase-binding transcription factor DksA
VRCCDGAPHKTLTLPEATMTSEGNEPPWSQGAPDIILMALFQSRLRERSLYLGQVIQSHRRRLSAAGRTGDNGDATLARLRLAEQALAAVQEAETRLGLGRYGVCENCHEPIAWDELLESPEQISCRGCGQRSAAGATRLRS